MTTNQQHVSALRALVESATKAWTTKHWCDAGWSIDEVYEALCAGKRIDLDDGQITSWIEDDGQPDHREHWTGIRAVERAIKESDYARAMELATPLSAECIGKVEGDAAEAAFLGQQAVEAATRGEWDSAMEQLRDACRLELRYGDDRAWGPAFRYAEAVGA